MTSSYLHFPEFDPVIFSIGPVSLHWYGLMYLVGFIFAMWLATRRANRPGSGWTKNEVENLLYAGFLGVFLGGRIGYVLAVAGSAVGLGNIWRFPYLAAKYGGGIFLLVYLLLTVSFGYVLIMSETALGRMTKKSPVGAFASFGNSFPFKLGGWLNAVWIPDAIISWSHRSVKCFYASAGRQEFGSRFSGHG